MKQLLKRLQRAVVPRYILEALFPIPHKPTSWDRAAADLDSLREHAERCGYPNYLYGLLCAARTAGATREKEFTAIEFGVAGGNGLVAMEQHAAAVEQLWNVRIHVVGFDTSSGLPQRTDPRDCPFSFRGGEFRMDEGKLRARLRRAELRLGDVADTVRNFASEEFPPIGFVSNDLDLYTSTRDSFHLLSIEHSRLLPRVTMYFDDLQGYPYTTVTGEWAAIQEFNTASEPRKIGQIYGLKYHIGRRYRLAAWPDAFFVLHVFDHPEYSSQEISPYPDEGLREKVSQ
jgi:hypothetical protein